MKSIRLLLLGCLLASGPCFASILAGPIQNPANDHYYYLLDQANWTASEAEALALGGHLATVNDLAENTWIDNTFSFWGGQARNLWIGLYDPNPAVDASTTSARRLEFVWVSGDASTYRNWSPTEPNPSFPNEHYVHLWRPGDVNQARWNDYQNFTSLAGFPMNGVVEASALIPEPASVALLLAGLGLLGFAAKRRRAFS